MNKVAGPMMLTLTQGFGTGLAQIVRRQDSFNVSKDFPIETPARPDLEHCKRVKNYFSRTEKPGKHQGHKLVFRLAMNPLIYSDILLVDNSDLSK